MSPVSPRLIHSLHRPRNRKKHIMTDPNYSALLLVIDRSGSMQDIRDDMVGGLENLLSEQAAQPGLLTVDVFTFDDQIDHTHTFADPSAVKVALDPRGSTALYDAIGLAVNDFGGRLASLPEHSRPSKVLVVIVTDGQENASREYTIAQVRDLINVQSEAYNWAFVFLGANQDAVLTATELGIDADSALTYSTAPDAVQAMSSSLSRYTTDLRRQQKRGFSDDERRDATGDSKRATPSS